MVIWPGSATEPHVGVLVSSALVRRPKTTLVVKPVNNIVSPLGGQYGDSCWTETSPPHLITDWVSKTPNQHTMSTLNPTQAALPCSDVCDITSNGEITGIAVPHTSNKQELTTFVNEAEITLDVRSRFTRNPMHVRDAQAEDLKSYLARPYRYAEGTCTTTFGQLSNFLVNATSMYVYVPRMATLTGSYGYRATFCVRLDVASNPFTPGVLKLSYYPASSNSNTEIAYSGASYWSHQATYVTPVSQLPGVYLDATEGTSVTLRVPWVHPQSFAHSTNAQLTLATECGIWGTFFLHQYMGVTVAAGTALPTWSLWTWLEDIELVHAAPNATGSASPQAGFDTIEREMMNTSQPVSRMLGLTARALRTVQGIPLISSLAGTALWLTRALGKTAASFGWSKPREVSGNTRVFATTNACEHLHTGTTTAITLGASIDNHLVPMAFAGTDLDEMSFEYILGHKACIAQGVLNSSDTVNVLKYAADVSPSSAFSQKNAANTCLAIAQTTATGAAPGVTGSVIWPSSLFWLGQCFRYWRGEIVYTIRFAKTKMHTGRVILWFIPDAYSSTKITGNVPIFTVPNFGQELSLLNVVWDLREGNVMEFAIPYTSPNAFTNFASSIGTFGMCVIEPLSGPPSVSTSVPFLIEVHARNMVFSGPMGPSYAPAPQAPAAAAIYSQSGDVKMDMTATQFCSGETFSSVKQMAARASWVEPATSPFTLPNPSNYTYTTTVGTGPYTATTINSPTMLDYLGTAFVLWRGSINYHCHTTGSGSTVNSSSIQIGLTSTMPINPAYGNGFMNSVIQEHNGACHASLPYYGANPCSFVRPASVASVQVFPHTGDVVPEFQARFMAAANSTANAHVGVSAGDDFQFGLFVMPPPLVLPILGSVGWGASSTKFPI